MDLPKSSRYEEVEQPSIQDGQDDRVLIKVHSASVNPYDYLFRKGFLPTRSENGFIKPKEQILGIDVAGTIEAVGKNVTRFKIGDHIFGSCVGSHAEYVRVRQSAISMMPKNSTFQEAATIPTAALTALQALSGFSCSQTESTPAHTPLTQTVGRSDLNLFKEQKYTQPSEHSSYVT